MFDVEVTVRRPYSDQVSAAWIGDVVRATLSAEDQPSGTSATIVITDDAEIRGLNQQYRDVDSPTDVLAFAATEGDPFVLPEAVPVYLGDVVISYPAARRQSVDAGHPVSQELALLVVHGCLHLLGYDHAGEREHRLMWARQDEILLDLGDSG